MANTTYQAQHPLTATLLRDTTSGGRTTVRFHSRIKGCNYVLVDAAMPASDQADTCTSGLINPGRLASTTQIATAGPATVQIHADRINLQLDGDKDWQYYQSLLGWPAFPGHWSRFALPQVGTGDLLLHNKVIVLPPRLPSYVLHR
jgi:hypothetical protein